MAEPREPGRSGVGAGQPEEYGYGSRSSRSAKKQSTERAGKHGKTGRKEGIAVGKKQRLLVYLPVDERKCRRPQEFARLAGKWLVPVKRMACESPGGVDDPFAKGLRPTKSIRRGMR
ncbi:hypothetical protein [Novosphingobium organovorum]|uniref:hypothetical protein n=1 Tax=Novosphingobium organovorum TaxID=2930092 RepID=UPI001FB9E35F|nr:hypothetical protein [Novosphingobium organovorum]